MHYRIGEFARLGGVSVKTLRFYDEIGVLQPARVDARTHYRMYSSQQLHQLTTIQALQDLGASLSDIASTMRADAPGPGRRKLLEKLRKEAARTMVAARQSVMLLDRALQEMDAGNRNVPVVIRHRPAVRVASVRAQAKSYEEIGVLERDLQRVIEPDLSGSLQGVLWHRCAASGVIEGEPFVEISARGRPCNAYDVRELPPASVATAYCEPTDPDAERVYDALSRWIHLHGLKLDGPKREIYVGKVLEVQFPIKRR